MKNIDNFFFKHINPDQFVFLAVFLSLIGDGSYLVFLKVVISSQENLKKWMHEYSFLPNMQMILENPAMIKQMWNSFQLILNCMIGAVLLTNIIGYIFFYNKKKFGINYMKSLALTGLIFSIFTLWETASYSLFWKSVMTALIPIYFYIYRGIKHYYITKNL